MILSSVADLYASARWRVSERLSRIFKAAGIRMQVPLEGRKRLATEVSFHSLRHTFCLPRRECWRAALGHRLYCRTYFDGYDTALLS